jgi:pilus assembly protein Flp/PilA
VKDFAADRSGVTSIEYAMIASLISILIIGGVISIGATVKGFFTAVSAGLK